MIISLSGPSGIGKGFIKEQLLQAFPFIKELAWFTTRPLRPNEKAGNRISVSISEFDKLVETGKLVLIQDLYGHRYGLKKESLLPSQQFSLTEFHPDNLSLAMEINPEIIAIGLVTSDLSFLRRRLSVIRNTEITAEIEQRVAVAKVEIETILRHKPLFATVIEVAEVSESSIFDQVLVTLTPHLTRKDKNHVT